MRKSNEMRECELRKLLGLPGLHQLPGVDMGWERRRLRGLEGVGRRRETRLPTGEAGCELHLRVLHKWLYFSVLCRCLAPGASQEAGKPGSKSTITPIDKQIANKTLTRLYQDSNKTITRHQHAGSALTRRPTEACSTGRPPNDFKPSPPSACGFQISGIRVAPLPRQCQFSGLRRRQEVSARRAR